MRIDRVTARAFGPLRDDSLEFAPGLTVVVGPNESGKTSWHAATRAALCGVRRGRGAATRTDAEFAARHRPWDDPERWEVDARLALDDGRTVDISQDLAGKVACRAVEVGLGRDVSHEIVDGTPDASRWLGLDRDAFAATMCVNQAQILSVVDSAAALQDHLQRAATTRGTDATAAEAIERLTAFRREKVGLDRENARGPLRLARNRLAMARDELADARRQHAEYLDLVERVELAQHAAAEAQDRLRVGEAAAAARDAQALVRRAARARELADRHRGPPTTEAARDAAADAVAAAIDAWRRRPTVAEVPGPAADELERELAAVPPPPDGDVHVHPDVAAALRELDRASDAVELLAERELPAAGAADGASPGRMPVEALAAAVTSGIGAVALFLLDSLLAALILLAVAAGAIGWGLVRRSGGRVSNRAVEVASEARRAEAAERMAAASSRLVTALQARGVEIAPDLRSAVARYERDCAARAEQAAASERAAPLRSAIAARRAADAVAREAVAAVASAGDALHQAARSARVGPDGLSPEDLVTALATWQRQRVEETRRAEEARAEWQELQALLSGSTLEALESAAGEAADRAERLVGEVGATPPALPPGDLARTRDALRERYDAARRQADELSGGLEVLSRQLPDVAEAEEALAAAEAEWDRVQALASTVDEALELLREAQDRVHRDLAPVLKEAILRWLPRVCAGRWADVAVDPATLAISVKEAETGRWREARLLSEGTREQIYLLLRVAMAQHLVTTDETAPIILDEVTAQCDTERKRRLLEVLHVVSAERQVIMFSHDGEVAAWADRTLAGPRDRLVTLGAVALEPVLV